MISLIAISIVFLLEAWLEQVVIAMKNPASGDYILNNHREHFRSAVFAAALILSALAVNIFVEKDYWLIIPIIISRRIWFDYGLIEFMGWSRSRYSGNDWWVETFKSIFGRNGRFRELVAEVAITFVCICIQIF